MCGIAGFLDPQRRCEPAAYETIVGGMADRLAHRGPDDRGVWCDSDAGIALGFRRLSIVDLSQAGHQPMFSSDGTLVMIYNGEIYNHRELRAQLEAAGLGPWRGHSDSEILLAAIARWGFAATLERLDGMFAIALWDRKARRLWLARDRFGEKPLYYGWKSGVLLFASELKAMQRHPLWQGDVDHAALGLFLRHGYVPTPWSAFREIYKLPPGAYATIPFGGKVETTVYWSAADRAAAAAAQPFAGDLVAATERLQSLIDAAVASRLIADVPVGAFLSGGIDSATIVAAMQHVQPGAVRSFTIAFPDAQFDESPHAAAVARHLGTDHTVLTVSEDDCLAVLPRLPEIYDEPFADASQIPTAALCRVTRSQVTVALSGDGGDELFGGYPRYRVAAARWRRIAPHPWLRRAAHGVTNALAGRNGHLARRLRKQAASWSHATPQSLYRDFVSRWQEGDDLTPSLSMPSSRFDMPFPAAAPSLEQAMMLLDVTTYLPDDLLVKTDRASMAVGLEARAPLLNHRIAEFAWSLPPLLMNGGGPKGVLRAVLYRRVPPALVDRPKQGFEPPVGRWLREGLREWAEELLASTRLERHGIVDPRVVTTRWAEHRDGRRSWTYPLWTVLMLEAWFEAQRERAAAA